MKPKWFPIWSIPLLVILATLTVWLRLSIIKTTYALTEAEKNIRDLQMQKEQAELRFAALRSPRRLELIAKTKFQLSPPRAEQVIHMKEGK